MSRPRANRFVPKSQDPREAGGDPEPGDERSTLAKFLRWQRMTLELKCSGLTAEQLAQRSVPPSTMSLLGLVRHMAYVEQVWFRKRMAGEEVALHFKASDNWDEDFDGAVADDAVVQEAWRLWRQEVAFAEDFVARTEDLGYVGGQPDHPISLRALLVHMVEEYARHNGHADLLRERIDGRIGQ